jgi:DNA-binding CsgD family transcriptional regulator
LRQKTNDHKRQWICSVVRDGCRPEIFEIETCEEIAQLNEAECFWIQYFRSIGCRLVNATNGGEGASGYRHLEEAKAKMSQSKRGKPSPQLGRHHSMESRLLISQSKTGLTFEQQKEIVDLYARGHTTYQVGEKFGVSATCVASLLDIFGVPVRTTAEKWEAYRKRKREAV